MNHIVNIKVKNRVAVWDDTSSEIICDNRDYTVTVDFDDEWSEIETKTARVYESGQYTDIVFTGNSFTAPPVHDTLIALIGIFSGDITTTPAIVPCKKSILSNGGEIADPPDDVYKQIIDMIESGMLKGEPGYAPTVSVTDITGGHRVTITDAQGEKSFDVMDGKDGQGGGSSVQPDWNQNDESQPDYVRNRTHWLERPYEPIVWDGSTEGRDSIDLSALELGIVYKVSDHILTEEDAASSTLSVSINTGESWNCSWDSFVDVSSAVEGIPEGFVKYGYAYAYNPQYGNYGRADVVSFSQAGDYSDSLGFVIPSSGTYFKSFDTDGIACFKIDSVIYHQIDSRYIQKVKYEDILNAPVVHDDVLRYGIRQTLGPDFAKNVRDSIHTLGEGEIFTIAHMSDYLRKKIGDYAFSNGNYGHIILELDNIKTIGRYAFSDNYYLEKAILPHVTQIHGHAFRDCSALKTVVLNNNATIGVDAFYGTKIYEGEGYIYVPADIVEKFKESNSELASQIRAIEDYPEITGG